MKKGLAGILVVAGMVIGSALTLVLSPVGAAGALVGAVGAPNSGHESILQQALDTLVGKGTITQKQAEAVTNQVQTLQKQHPQGMHPFGGPGGHGFAAFGPGLDPIGSLATLLKTDPQTLMGELRSGKSIADVAKEKGVDLKSLENSLVTDAQSHLDQAVKSGWLTQQQADNLKSKLAAEIDKLVNQKWDQGFAWHGGPGFGPGEPAPSAPAPGSGTTVPPSPSAPIPATPPTTSAPSTTPPSTTVPSTTPTTA